MDAFIGLGSNLGDRRAHLRAALAGLRCSGLVPLAVSSVWESEPVDAPGSPWFLNMAVKIRGGDDPLDLLDRLLAIEREAGRVRDLPNAPRTLDLDLLMLGSLEWRNERLCLPHPRMWQRRFVLEALAEIAPELLNPASGRSVAEERRRLGDSTVVYRVGRLETC